jgi:hypothetical protein
LAQIQQYKQLYFPRCRCRCRSRLPNSLLLALRQDRMHGLVNCGSLLRQPKRTFHYGFKLGNELASIFRNASVGTTVNTTLISFSCAIGVTFCERKYRQNPRFYLRILRRHFNIIARVRRRNVRSSQMPGKSNAGKFLTTSGRG